MVDVGDEATSGPYNGGEHLWDGTTARRDCWDMGEGIVPCSFDPDQSAIKSSDPRFLRKSRP